jgi:Myb/SANT-like DNA-binding protein
MHLLQLCVLYWFAYVQRMGTQYLLVDAHISKRYKSLLLHSRLVSLSLFYMKAYPACLSKPEMPRFQWLEAYELTFFQSLLDSIRDGLRADSSLKPEAWRRAIDALRDTHEVTVTKQQLTNKYDNAKKKFRIWRSESSPALDTI